MAYKDSAKQWFEQGDFPTQAQFAQVFDWLRWIDQQLQLSDVAGLTELLQNKVDKNTALIAPANLDATFLVQVTDPTTGKIYAVPISQLCALCSSGNSNQNTSSYNYYDYYNEDGIGAELLDLYDVNLSTNFIGADTSNSESVALAINGSSVPTLNSSNNSEQYQFDITVAQTVTITPNNPNNVPIRIIEGGADATSSYTLAGGVYTKTFTVGNAVPNIAIKFINTYINFTINNTIGVNTQNIQVSSNDCGTMDWGDGSGPQYFSGVGQLSHTYSTNGSYNCVMVYYNGPNDGWISLSGMGITAFEANLPAEVYNLDLSNNQLTEFDPAIPLPSGLYGLHLNNNLLTSFNPTLPLPAGLFVLYVSNNQLTTFSPTLPLPSGLNQLILYGNQLTSFNLAAPYPADLVGWYLNNNPLTSAEVDSIIEEIDTMGIAGYHVLFLNETPAAPPTSASAAAMSDLQANGWVIYHD